MNAWLKVKGIRRRAFAFAHFHGSGAVVPSAGPSPYSDLMNTPFPAMSRGLPDGPPGLEPSAPRVKRSRSASATPVSYTHLTLPTICSV
eukprot:274472-Alexandrium_andersonii.AAC.1